MTLTLWGNGASRAFVVHWMLHELELRYEKRLIGARTGETQTEEFLRLNPAGKIPVLEDGNLVLTECAAIVTYLAERYGEGSALIPRGDLAARAKYDQWCFFAATELDAQSLYIVHKHTTLSRIYGEAPTAVETAKQTYLRQVAVLDHALGDDRSWILGPDFTAADVLIARCLAWGERYELSLPERSRRYLTRATSRAAHRAAVAAAAG